MPEVEHPMGQSATADDVLFGWLQRDLSELRELVIVVGDACHCSPGLRENVDEVVTTLGEDALCVVSLAALVDGGDELSRLRLAQADARVAIFGCKKHDHIETIEKIGPLDSALSLDPDQLSAHASQIKGMLQGLLREQHLLTAGHEFEALPAAAHPPTRTFSNREVETALVEALSAAPKPELVARPAVSAPQPVQSAPSAAPMAPAPVGGAVSRSVDPASAPSQSYFSRGAPVGGAYFTRPKQSNFWKWMFLLLLGGIVAYGLANWWGAAPSDPPKDSGDAPATGAGQASPKAVPRRATVPREPDTRLTPRGAPAVVEPDRPTPRIRPRPVTPRVRRRLPPRRRPDARASARRRALMRKSRRINVNWIGGVCSTGQDCSYPLALCLPTRSVGFCTRQCEKLCPDRHRSTDTTSFCVDSPLVRSQGKIPLGLCLAACNYKLFPGSGCRIGMWCRKLSWRRNPKQKKRVCVPIAK